MNQYTEPTRQKLLELNDKYGLKTTIKVASQMLDSRTHKSDKEFQAGLHGEICETVLEILLKAYIKANGRNDWYISKSLIVINNGMTAELDLTVFTPKRIYMFECKCYSGDKIITDECKINRKGIPPHDLYGQSMGHLRLLNEVIGGLKYRRPSYIEPYKLAYFNFAKGSLLDKRNKAYIKTIPILGIANLHTIFYDYDKLPNQWDIKKVLKVIKTFEKHHDNLEKKHLKRLGVRRN